jgi:hypothetical protein
VNLRNNLRNMMSDEENAESGASEFAHGVAKFHLAGDVQGVSGFVEEQGVRFMNQGAGDQGALGFSGRHFENGAVSEVGNPHAGEGGMGPGAVFGVRVMIGENARAAEEAGKDNIEAGGLGGAGGEEIGGDDAEGRTEFKNIPEGAAENGDGRIFALKGVALAREGLDEGGFAGAVGTKDADVFAHGDAEGKAVKGDVIATEDGDVAELEERGRGVGHRKSIPGLRIK